MINLPDPFTIETHSRLLGDIRFFFSSRGFLEVETPLLNPTPNTEPYLYPLEVTRNGPRRSPHGERDLFQDDRAYLITSPEYNLKILLSHLQRSLYQIAHSFRGGDLGPLHTEEFLMLEYYLYAADDRALMELTEKLLRFLLDKDYNASGIPPETTIHRKTIKELFWQYAGCETHYESLLDRAKSLNLISQSASPTSVTYDDVFFLVFLNQIETKLETYRLILIHDYPPELAANARTIQGVARRFELYWDGVELANAYYEISNKEEQLEAFRRDNEKRKQLGREPAALDSGLINAFNPELPESSGAALGIDRLFLLLCNEGDLKRTSPFAL